MRALISAGRQAAFATSLQQSCQRTPPQNPAIYQPRVVQGAVLCGSSIFQYAFVVSIHKSRCITFYNAFRTHKFWTHNAELDPYEERASKCTPPRPTPRCFNGTRFPAAGSSTARSVSWAISVGQLTRRCQMEAISDLRLNSFTCIRRLY